MNILAILEGSAFCAGMAMGIASIMSVGPNNLTLVREGLMHGRIGLVATVMWASYLVLLASALILGDNIAQKGAVLKPLLSWLGFLALCWFAFLSLRAYFTASNHFRLGVLEQEPKVRCVRRILAIVWCNPLTYVELLIIPAAVSCSFMMPVCRVLFVTGLLLMATIACYGYSFGGRLLASYLRRESTMKFFDLASGLIMSVLAIVMATGLILTAN